MRFMFFLILCSTLCAGNRGPDLHYNSFFEQHFYESVISHPDSLSFSTGILIAEGLLDSVKINVFNTTLNNYIKSIEKELDKDDDLEEQAEFIYEYLYNTILKTKNSFADFSDIFNSKSFNEQVACNLYFIICERLGIPLNIYSTNLYHYAWFTAGKDTLKIFFDSIGESFNKDNDEIQENDNNLITRSFITILNTLEERSPQAHSFLIDQMSQIYNIRGIRDIKKSFYKNGLNNFEKALFLNPNNYFINQNYENALFKLHSVTGNYSEFIPYLKNAFWLVDKNDFNINNMLTMIAQALYHFSIELQDFDQALDFIFDARIAFRQQEISVFLDKTEKEVYLERVSYYIRRGNFKKAYSDSKKLYYQNDKLPLYKEVLIQTGMMYYNKNIYNNNFSKEMDNIIDTLYQEAPDYYTVKETYIAAKLHPIIGDPDVITKTPLKARKMVMPIYHKFPKNESVKKVVARIYYQLGMNKMEKDKLKEAFSIFEKGLKYDPGNKLLENAMDSILRKFE